MPEKRYLSCRICLLGLIFFTGGSILGACRSPLKRLSICEVQGTGEISRYVGEKVTLQGLVSAVIADDIPSGFFLVDQDCPDDQSGSRGIFVEVETSESQVHIGDEIRVRGLIDEVGGETRIKCNQDEMEALSLGNDLPPGIDLPEEFFRHPTSLEYENWEGMLVTLPVVEFLEDFSYSDQPRARPLFKLDPALEMVCLQNQSVALQISSSWDNHRLENISIGDLVQNLSGILRQNTNGYMLELIASSDLAKVSRNTSPGVMAGSTFSDLGLTGTRQISSSETPSAAPINTSTSTIIPSATVVPSPTYYPVTLLISEVYPNPNAKEPDGEWIEIYNPETYAQLLTGVKLGDETSPTGKEGMLRFPDGYYIESTEVLVIANQAKTFLSEFGFLPDFEMNDSDSRIPDLLPYGEWGRSAIKLSNSGDQVLLLDPWDGVVDLLAYGNSEAAGFSGPPPAAPKEGHSLERYPPDRDRDRGGDWRERELVSPGRLDRSPPTQADPPTIEPSLTITPSPQISPSEPASLTPTRSATIVWTGTSTSTEEAAPSLRPSPSLTGTITAAPQLSLTPSISPTPAPFMTETVEITQTPTISISPSLIATHSITVNPSATDTPIPEVSATSAEECTDTPQPSITSSATATAAATMIYLEDPDILLNEVHADPDLILGDANHDGLVHSDDDEFLEFVNVGENDLDLGGWEVADSLKVRYIFPVGTILKMGCGALVFGGGEPQGTFGGSLIFSAGSLGLNNTGDSITLLDQKGEIKIYYEYGSEGGENQSLTRSPDITGKLPLILHSEAVGSNGDAYSPGLTVNGSSFGNCP